MPKRKYAVLRKVLCRFFQADMILSALFLIGTIGGIEQNTMGLAEGILLLIVCFLSFMGALAALIALGEIHVDGK